MLLHIISVSNQTFFCVADFLKEASKCVKTMCRHRKMVRI